MQTLAVLLQRERLLLELLVVKITDMRHLAAASDARSLGRAAEEVERAVDAVRSAELERVVTVADCVAELLGDSDVDFDDESALDVVAGLGSSWRKGVLRSVPVPA